VSNVPTGPVSRLAPSFLPATAVLEMTYLCNHKCVFCSCPWERADGDFDRREELSVDEWKETIRRLTGMGVCHLAFTGGEPLLKKGLFEIIEFAASCLAEHVETVDGRLQSRHAPPKLYLLSNGSAVDRRVLEFCKRLDVQLSMSLPGLSTFREHTQYGDPDVILDRFREARAMGLSTVVNVTVTRKNLDELYKTLSAAFLAGAGQLLMNRFLPGGRGLRYAGELSLDKDQVRQMLDTAEEVLQEANRSGSVGTELPKCIVDSTRYQRLEIGTRCSATIGFFVIGPSGYVRTCNHSPVRLHHVHQIDRVKTDPYWMRFTQKDYLPAACGGCEQSSACDGGCREAAHIVGGALDAPDPLLPCPAV
jgi:radical SAM protein with 4Fe4S-binding SPASM domain